MPFKSKAQQRFLFAKHPKTAKEFAKATPSIKALPEKVKPKRAPLQRIPESIKEKYLRHSPASLLEHMTAHLAGKKKRVSWVEVFIILYALMVLLDIWLVIFLKR